MMRHKFNARPSLIEGVRFASQKEARRWHELKLAEKAGIVRNLRPHPEFALFVIRPDNGEVVTVGKYTADSAYDLKQHGEWVPMVEDVKCPATRTTAYRLRKRIVEGLYGFQIQEV